MGVMNYPDQYRIAFSGLKAGMHAYEFMVDNSFFEKLGDEVISGGVVTVGVNMMKDTRMMDFQIEINGKVTVACDRCNDPLEQPVSGKERLIVKLGDKYYEESEEVQVIPETDSFFDLSPFLYEYIHLLLPVRRIHPDDQNGNSTCNPNMLKILNEMVPEHIPDPRWEVLRTLKNDTEC